VPSHLEHRLNIHGTKAADALRFTEWSFKGRRSFNIRYTGSEQRNLLTYGLGNWPIAEGQISNSHSLAVLRAFKLLQPVALQTDNFKQQIFCALVMIPCYGRQICHGKPQ
jgi:hypothetical protein